MHAPDENKCCPYSVYVLCLCRQHRLSPCRLCLLHILFLFLFSLRQLRVGHGRQSRFLCALQLGFHGSQLLFDFFFVVVRDAAAEHIADFLQRQLARLNELHFC